MDAFNYLAVLLSIIIGLGLTQVLSASGRLIRGREHVRPYWPPLLWAGVLIVIYVQVWWSMFGLRRHQNWDFLAFFLVLLQTVTLYMMAALVLPEQVHERGVDLHEHYARHAPWMYGFFAATLVVSFVKEIVLQGRMLEPVNMAFHVFLFGVALVGILVRRPMVHRMLAVLCALVIGTYIALLFARLN